MYRKPDFDMRFCGGDERSVIHHLPMYALNRSMVEGASLFHPARCPGYAL